MTTIDRSELAEIAYWAVHVVDDWTALATYLDYSDAAMQQLHDSLCRELH